MDALDVIKPMVDIGRFDSQIWLNRAPKLG
jgi:hypothetical protein